MSLAEQMQAQEFDHVWTIQDDAVVDAKGSAPSVYCWQTEGGAYMEEVESDEWDLVSHGMTGQYGYNGPVLHASENFSRGMAERLAELVEDYSAFATVVIEDVEDPESEPAGWAIVGRRR